MRPQRRVPWIEEVINVIFPLTEDRKKQLENLAEDIRDEYNLDFPVDATRFAKERLYFEVLSMQMDNPSITGMILVDPTVGRREIGVNKDLGYKKGRFIVAHEIGHFMIETLEKKQHGVFAFRDNSNREGTESEAEAEYFARCFLMPREYMEAAVRVFKKIGYKEGWKLTSFISEFFGVTEKKAERRLKELSLNEA